MTVDTTAGPGGSDYAYLRNRDFVLLCIARFGVQMGSQMQFVAIGWFIYQVTRDPFALALVGLATFLPAASLMLITGLAADRYDRPKLLALSSAGMVLATVGQLAHVSSGADFVWPMYLIILIYGAARAFFQPATAALLPTLLPPSQFTNAVAFATGVFQTATLVGPALGGILYWFHPLLPFGVAATLYAISFFSHLAIRPRPQAPRTDQANTWTHVMAGFAFIRSKPVILGAITLDMFAIVLGGAVGLLPIYAADILMVDEWGLGLLRSAPAVGGILITALITRYSFVKHHAGYRMMSTVAIFGLATVVFGLSENFFLSFLCLAIAGAADMVSVVIRVTLVQAETPDDLRGRVSAVNSLFTLFSNEIGQFRAGGMAGFIGAVPAVVIGGAGAIALAVGWTRLFPELARRDHLVAPVSGENAKA